MQGFQSGDLVFIRGKRFFDQPIKLISGSKYTHVAGIVWGTKLIEAQGLRATGFQNLVVYKGELDIYRCEYLTSTQRQGIVRFVVHELGTRYDYLLILWEAVRLVSGVFLPYIKNNRRICSTLWADAYRAAGIDLCPKVSYPTPGELAKSKLLTQIGSY